VLRRLKQETIVWTLNHGRLPCSRHVVNAAETLAIHGYDESHRRAFFFDGHCQIDCRLSRCTFSAKNGCFFDRKRKKTENNEIYFCPEIKLAKTIQSPYFRHWKLKWSSVGLYIGPVKSSLKMTIEWDMKPDYTAAVYWLCISSLALKYYSVCHCKFCYYIQRVQECSGHEAGLRRSSEEMKKLRERCDVAQGCVFTNTRCCWLLIYHAIHTRHYGRRFLRKICPIFLSACSDGRLLLLFSAVFVNCWNWCRHHSLWEYQA